jgi:hypothetical protein
VRRNQAKPPGQHCAEGEDHREQVKPADDDADDAGRGQRPSGRRLQDHREAQLPPQLLVHRSGIPLSNDVLLLLEAQR